MTLESIAVVGASLAGLRAVEALRRRGYDGNITWIGAEPALPYDRPPLSKQVLRGEWARERVPFKVSIDALRADLRLGKRAVSLDVRARRLTLDDSAVVAYDGLVIATGATPRTLPNSEAIAGVHTLRTLDDALAIRRALESKPKVVVIGAGFIGLEVAASCRTLGLDVTVIEMASLPLAAALGDEFGGALRAFHEDHGVVMHLATRVVDLLGEREVAGVRLGDGAVVEAGVVVVGIGVVPETRWLEGSGVALDRGVLTDASCCTNVPGVVACGDVTRSFSPLFGETLHAEHWTNAVEQANAAAASLLGQAAPPMVPAQAQIQVPYFWSDQYDAKIQFAGRATPRETFRVLEGSLRERNLVALYERDGVVRAALTVNKPGALVRYRHAIGAGRRV